MPGKHVVLIHPPFCMPDKPYISTAVLYAHLMEQGIDVSVLDLNIEFYREYLSLENIGKGLDFIEKRMESMNTPNSHLEQEEYRRIIHVKQRMAGETPPFHLLFKDSGLSNVEQFMLFSLGLDIVSTLHFPERLEFLINTGYIRYRSPWSKFSSRDIIRSIDAPTLYADTIKKLLTRYFKQDSPTMAGLSVSFPDQILPAFYAASVIKSMNPRIHVSMGGTFVSSHMRDLKNTRLFDYVDSLILDEGEIPLLELVECLRTSNDFRSVPGLIYRQEETVVTNPPAPRSIPRKLTQPDYGSTDLERYLVNSRSMALLIRLSQGCYWHQCSFCRTERSFVCHYVCADLDEIIAWIDECVRRHPVRILHFTDDAADPDVLYDLSCHLIQKDTDVTWITNMRFDSRITPEKLETYKKAGCRAIYFGLESCTPRVLKKMKKGISVNGVEKTLKACRSAGIPVHLYMIVGFPTETEEEALASFSMVYQWRKEGLAREVIYNVFQISGGSDIALNPKNYGISAIDCPPESDLDPPVSSFASKGMTREKAESLCLDFITQLSRIPSYSRKDMMEVFFE